MSETIHRNDRSVVGRVTTRNGELQLAEIRAGQETHYELIFEGVFLMATYSAPSCRMLMDAVLDSVSSRRNVSLLIGGLGMGVALRRALAHPGVQMVCVVELEPLIVEWNRTYLGNADILDDPRTEVVLGDFHDYVQGTPRSYHGIAMDIDNGPDWVVRPENRRAYSLSMLRVLRTRLRSGSALSIWSHAHNRSYERALQEAFGEVEMWDALDHDLNGRPLKSVIYVARA